MHLWLRFQRPLHMVKARLEKWEQSREWALPYSFKSGDNMSGLSVTLVDTSMASLPCTHASADRGLVGYKGTPLKRPGSSRQDATAGSKTGAILRSTTLSYFGEATGVYSRRIVWWFSSVTNSPLMNYVPLSERRHSTMVVVPCARMSARKPAKTAGTSDFSLRT